ncbi:MAG: hypothetical protein R2940_03520 [Syntrophotaleaceae bacterium]
MQKLKQFVIKMGKQQTLKVFPSCKTCGGESEGAGYFCGSDSEGNGFVIWIDDEQVCQVLERVLAEQLPAGE